MSGFSAFFAVKFVFVLNPLFLLTKSGTFHAILFFWFAFGEPES